MVRVGFLELRLGLGSTYGRKGKGGKKREEIENEKDRRREETMSRNERKTYPYP